MKILVSGATGFIGRHLIPRLLDNHHEVTILSRKNSIDIHFPWISKVDHIKCDLNIDFPQNLFAGFDKLVHLAWEGLPNYQSPHHVLQNLPRDLFFLNSAISSGIKEIIITGTCFEYGMQSGALREDAVTSPITSYGLAKDCLRKILQNLQDKGLIKLKWIRLFYLYGEGQNPNSLFSQLDRAIDAGEPSFNMSKGNQLRDYLSIEKASQYISDIIESEELKGVINCCSGNPVSVESMIVKRIDEKNAVISLNKGFYDMAPYEPLNFWGIPNHNLL